LFLAQTGDPVAAESALRRAMAIDLINADPMLDFDRESLASVLETIGKREEAVALYREAAGGPDAKVSARSFAGLAKLDPAHADSYYRNAVEAEEKAYGPLTGESRYYFTRSLSRYGPRAMWTKRSVLSGPGYVSPKIDSDPRVRSCR
jgi:hypothetical protein